MSETGPLFDDLDAAVSTVLGSPRTAVAATFTYLHHPELVAMSLKDALSDKCAFGLRKNSEFTRIFNHYITKLSQDGMLRKVIGDGLPDNALEAPTTASEAKITILGYADLIFPFMCLAVGTVVGGALLVVDAGET